VTSKAEEYFDVVDEQDRVTGRALRREVHAREGLGVVGLQEVPVGQEHLYGVVGGDLMPSPPGATTGRTLRLTSLVEKPAPGTAPSRMAATASSPSAYSPATTKSASSARRWRASM
jgi:UTP-glucose-1-phosphate uridylyltransferase